MNMGKDEATGQIMFEFHRARVLSESKDELRDKFKRSPEFTAMCPAYPKKKQDIRLKHAVPLAREATKERLPCDEVATAYRTPLPACLVLIVIVPYSKS